MIQIYLHIHGIDRVREGFKKEENKLGCASVKLLVLLEFVKTLLDFIIKKKIEFFFQIGKGKYELGLGKIIIFISILTQFTKSNCVLASIGDVFFLIDLF